MNLIPTYTEDPAAVAAEKQIHGQLAHLYRVMADFVDNPITWRDHFTKAIQATPAENLESTRALLRKMQTCQHEWHTERWEGADVEEGAVVCCAKCGLLKHKAASLLGIRLDN